jgi:hypothetical protein
MTANDPDDVRPYIMSGYLRGLFDYLHRAFRRWFATTPGEYRALRRPLQ